MPRRLLLNDMLGHGSRCRIGDCTGGVLGIRSRFDVLHHHRRHIDHGCRPVHQRRRYGRERWHSTASITKGKRRIWHLLLMPEREPTELVTGNGYSCLFDFQPRDATVVVAMVDALSATGDVDINVLSGHNHVADDQGVATRKRDPATNCPFTKVLPETSNTNLTFVLSVADAEDHEGASRSTIVPKSRALELRALHHSYA